MVTRRCPSPQPTNYLARGNHRTESAGNGFLKEAAGLPFKPAAVESTFNLSRPPHAVNSRGEIQ